MEPASITTIDFGVSANINKHPVPGDSDTGYLGAELKLTVNNQITLEDFHLDLSNGDFYWKITDPMLTDMIPDGDETSVIHTESYATALTDMGTAMTDYMTEQQVALVFSDGIALLLGSGESPQYDSESKCYKSWFNIFSDAEDQGADVIDKTPDHLLIGGTEYKLISTQE